APQVEIAGGACLVSQHAGIVSHLVLESASDARADALCQGLRLDRNARHLDPTVRFRPRAPAARNGARPVRVRAIELRRCQGAVRETGPVQPFPAGRHRRRWKMTYVDRVSTPLAFAVSESADDESHVVRRAQSGDMRAFERLYRSHV